MGYVRLGSPLETHEMKPGTLKKDLGEEGELARDARSPHLRVETQMKSQGADSSLEGLVLREKE